MPALYLVWKDEGKCERRGANTRLTGDAYWFVGLHFQIASVLGDGFEQVYW